MSCPYYKFESSGWFGGDYTCIKDPNNKKIIGDDHYRRYCRDYNYRECPTYRYEESSGCFITTVLCNVLGLPDNHETLNTLRNFRDNILQKDESYKEILQVYDSIGPMVADKIMKDDNREEIALDLYKSSLLPIVEEVNNNNYNRAIKHYLYMTLFLVSDYNLRDTYNALKEVDFGFTNFNQKTAGHGRKLVRETSK